MSDFSRFTAAQVRDHVAFNQRSVRLQPQLFDGHQRTSLDRAGRLRIEIDEEIRAFEKWRAAYLSEARQALASADADTMEAVAMAHRAMERLQRTWNAVEQLEPGLAEQRAGRDRA